MLFGSLQPHGDRRIRCGEDYSHRRQRGAEVFTDDACQSVYRATEGVPRLINQLCDHALLVALSDGRRRLEAAHIEEAWADLQQLPTPWNGDGPAGPTDKPGVIEFGRLDDMPEEPAESIKMPTAPLRVASAADDLDLDSIEQLEPAAQIDSIKQLITGAEDFRAVRADRAGNRVVFRGIRPSVSGAVRAGGDRKRSLRDGGGPSFGPANRRSFLPACNSERGASGSGERPQSRNGNVVGRSGRGRRVQYAAAAGYAESPLGAAGWFEDGGSSNCGGGGIAGGRNAAAAGNTAGASGSAKRVPPVIRHVAAGQEEGVTVVPWVDCWKHENDWSRR